MRLTIKQIESFVNYALKQSSCSACTDQTCLERAIGFEIAIEKKLGLEANLTSKNRLLLRVKK